MLIAMIGGTDAALLNYGDIHSNETVSSWASYANSYGAWSSGAPGYLGLLLPAGNYYTDWYFGWMALDYVLVGNYTTLTISGFAFESEPGQPIVAARAVRHLGLRLSPSPALGSVLNLQQKGEVMVGGWR